MAFDYSIFSTAVVGNTLLFFEASRLEALCTLGNCYGLFKYKKRDIPPPKGEGGMRFPGIVLKEEARVGCYL